MNPLRPYFVRAVHEWCLDNAYTPYLMVVVDEQTQVPMNFVQNGEIVLNLSAKAVGNLLISNEDITFSARFSGVPHHLYIPMNNVTGIYAKETGQGMFFESTPVETTPIEGEQPAKQAADKKNSPKAKKNHLKLIK
jgi:stringent starvation protein B